jgi:alpha-mannosidase
LTSPAAPAAAPDPAGRPTLFLVYTVHLDTQWRWTVRDTIRQFLPATLAGNFALLRDHPDRVLSFEGAFRYRLIEEYYPADFARLRELVAAGRWRPAGNMLDSPDVNCVAPESLLRHILYARRYFASRFGAASEDLFLPDCFGFGHALPTIAAHCGLTGFSSQKFGNWGAPAELPFDVGVWLGPDGEGVIAALRPEGYGEGLHEDLSHATRWLERCERQFASSGLRLALMYVGLGDRGGRLGEASLRWIERSVGGDGPLRVVQAGSDALFAAIAPEARRLLPRHQGELLLPTHGTGCWTSQAAAKRWNRDCERAADRAERAASLARWLGVMPYPGRMLRQAWERFLWHQMHDDLTGTSLPEAYRFTWNDQLVARNQFATVFEDALAAVAAGLDTAGPGRPLVVFNPLERRRCDLVEATLDWPGAPLAIEAVGPTGDVVPVQVVERRTDRLRVVFAPPLPPLGVAVWRLRPAGGAAPSDLEVGPRFLANALFRLELDAAGDVASLEDRLRGAELLTAPLRLELLPDRSRRWPAWEIMPRDVAAAPRPLGRGRIEVVEAGPVRAVLEVRRRGAGSRYRQRWILGAGAAGERIDCRIDVDWRSRGRLLKLALRQPAAGEAALYGLGCGVIRRGLNSPTRYEVPGLWAAPAKAPEDGALALIAAGQAGWDHPDAETLRASLLRSPRVLRKFRHQGRQDIGHHPLELALARHRSPAATEEHARRFHQPPVARPVASHHGPLGRSISLLELDEGATARAVKTAEDGPGLVVRLQEADGRPRQDLRLKAGGAIRRAVELDGCEVERRGLEPAGDVLSLDLTPFALRTLRLDVEAPASRPEPVAFTHLELAFDSRATSRQGEAGVRFGAAGHSFPAELWPDSIRVGAVPFRLGPATAANSLRAAGQSLDWTVEATALYLLAASVEGPGRFDFRCGGRRVRLAVDRWDGILGCWKGWRRGLGQLRWAPPGGGFERRDTVGWVATHRHDRHGADEPYEAAYLFRYRIDLPPATRRLVLPRSDRLRVFAVTVR